MMGKKNKEPTLNINWKRGLPLLIGLLIGAYLSLKAIAALRAVYNLP